MERDNMMCEKYWQLFQGLMNLLQKRAERRGARTETLQGNNKYQDETLSYLDTFKHLQHLWNCIILTVLSTQNEQFGRPIVKGAMKCN